MSPQGPLAVAYLDPSRLHLQDAGWKDGILGAVCYGDQARSAPAGDWPAALVGTPRVDAPGDLCELWRTAAPIRAGAEQGVAYRCTDDLLFGVVTELEGKGGEAAAQVQGAAERGYGRLFSLVDALGYPNLVRTWNYFAEINIDEQGLERYRRFNAGRQDAFLAAGRSVSAGVPAACALGVGGQPLTIAFLAARCPIVAIENPRQVSAYSYPVEYGSRSPTFSRATLLRLPGQEVLFLSGTASIGGHRTLHPGDVTAQTRETLANLQAVLDAANRVTERPGFVLDSLYLKVYLREPADLETVGAVITQTLGPGHRAVYLQADICRSDLLVEIEATAGLQVQSQ